MSDYTELKAKAVAATQGEWQVIETELPCRIGRPHVERRIFTAKDHPQLKAPYPVVNGSVALGTDETPVHHMVSMNAEDAAYIAAANPAVVLALIAENERLTAILAQQKSRRADDDECLSLATQSIDELRKDAERYQWVVDNPVLARAYLVTDLGQGIYMKSKAWEINRDIDAAMGKVEQS